MAEYGQDIPMKMVYISSTQNKWNLNTSLNEMIFSTPNVKKADMSKEQEQETGEFNQETTKFFGP